jgi:hypothetical protein
MLNKFMNGLEEATITNEELVGVHASDMITEIFIYIKKGLSDFT